MAFRDRIKELRRIPAGELKRHPLNWRRHPAAQRRALVGVLEELGFADALVARELEDGSLELVDGHLRAETAADEQVPVLVVDLDEQEARKLLSVLDPLAAMAETDEGMLAKLSEGLAWQEAEIAALVERWAGGEGERGGVSGGPTEAVEPARGYQVVVDCRDEAEQRQVYERMTGEGRRCRLLMLW